jgi:hypothetical protein
LFATHALARERSKGNAVAKVRLLSSGEARAYCPDGYSYLFDPIAVLLAEPHVLQVLARHPEPG